MRCEVQTGCCLSLLANISKGAVNLTVTSPPYFQQKDYSADGQLGWEGTVDAYVKKLREVLKLLYRATSREGAAFLVIGDTYRRGSMQLIPQRLAIEAYDVGWKVRNNLVWWKTDPAPGRTTKRWRSTYENVLFLTRSAGDYVFNDEVIRQPYSPSTLKRWGRGQKYGGPKSRPLITNGTKKNQATGNRFATGKSFNLHPNGTIPEDVIRSAAGRTSDLHYATFPLSLVERFVLVASRPHDLVLDPFAGTGTTGEVALTHNRRFLGIEISPSFSEIARNRLDVIAARTIK